MAKNDAKLGLDITDFERKTSKAVDSLNKFSTKGIASMNGLAGSVGRLAGSFGLVVSAVNALKNSINTAKEFESSISSLSSLTGLTGDRLDTLKKKAIELGSSTTQTATQVVKAMQTIGSAMPTLLADEDKLANVTQNAITLAEAAGIDVAEASAALTNSLNQMGASADESGRFINVLAAGSKNGAGNIQYLSDAIVKSGAMARMAGVSYEQLVAMIESVAKSGIDASTAGTELRNIMLKLESQTNNNLKPSVVGLTEALKNLKEEEMDSAEMKNFFGKRTLVVAANLLEEADNMGELLDKITGTSTAYEQAETNTDNFEGSIKRLTSAWEGLNLAINQSNGALRGAVDGLTIFLSKASDLVNGDSFGTSLVSSKTSSRKLEVESYMSSAINEWKKKGYTKTEAYNQAAGRVNSLRSQAHNKFNAIDWSSFASVETQNKNADITANMYAWDAIDSSVLKRLVDSAFDDGNEIGKNLAEGVVSGFDIDTATMQQIKDEISNLKNLARNADSGSIEQNTYYQQIDRLQKRLREITAKSKDIPTASGQSIGLNFSNDRSIVEVQAAIRSWQTAYNKAGDDAGRAYAQSMIDRLEKEMSVMKNGGVMKALASKADFSVSLNTGENPLDEMSNSADNLQSSLKGAAGGVLNLGNTIAGLGDSFDNCKTAWDYFSTSLSSAISIMDAVTTVTTALTSAKTVETAATLGLTSAEAASTAASATNTAAKATEATVTTLDAGAKFMDAHAWIPFVGVALGGAAIGVMLATLLSLPKFATGGIVGGNSYEGDKLLARVNSGEAILNTKQQARLNAMLDNAASMREQVIRVDIKNDKLTGTLSNAYGRSRYTN